MNRACQSSVTPSSSGVQHNEKMQGLGSNQKQMDRDKSQMLGCNSPMSIRCTVIILEHITANRTLEQVESLPKHKAEKYRFNVHVKKKIAIMLRLV
ncbi:hypothetical protein U9M48_036952 [Paspalum notatum var. saurae]|uniref:Uncharacterized protein n=1 Tax=Paspalum notatum var. saurae TaxID=547442 RepID=A0AAQ3XA29_PASNO